MCIRDYVNDSGVQLLSVFYEQAGAIFLVCVRVRGVALRGKA